MPFFGGKRWWSEPQREVRGSAVRRRRFYAVFILIFALAHMCVQFISARARDVFFGKIIQRLCCADEENIMSAQSV